MILFRAHKLTPFFTFSTSNLIRTRLKPVVASFPASPSELAFLLSTSEAKVRSQMLNPRGNTIDKEEAQLISLINGFKIGDQKDQEIETSGENVKRRSPIVTIMGHVDHGKTTLLDYLRESDIAKGEYGGITQKIGAFRVQYKNEKITVIDTPGHQAFVNMRLRGATVTDMIVVVISAIEGVKPQTMEVIQLAQKSQIPFLVAINKIDIPEADPEAVEKELSQRGILLEPHGGDIPVVHISAKTGLNVDLLIELILQQAQNQNIKANFAGGVEASVLQAHNSNNDINSATILIQKGTLKPGAILVVGNQMCRAKTIVDDKKTVLQQAYPGEAVEVVGFKQLPCSGDLVFQVQNETKARFILEKKQAEEQARGKKETLAPSAAKIKIATRKQKRELYRGFADLWLNKFKEVEETILQDIEEISQQPESPAKAQLLAKKQADLSAHKLYVFQYLEEAARKSNAVNLLIKSSDRGTEETVLKEVEKLKAKIFQTMKIEINILRSEVGDVYEADIQEASLFKGHIFCMGTSLKPDALKAMKTISIVPHNHKLLHTFLEDLKALCEGVSKKEEAGIKQKGVGQIAEVFKVSLDKKIQSLAAGVKIEEGRICKKYKYKIFRNGKPVSDLIKITSMKHFKKEVIELKKGDECTILFEGDVKFMKGDILKAFE